MYSNLTLEGEIERVERLPKPFASCVSYMDHDLCKIFLYHCVVRQGGIFNNAWILHLHHTNLPLVVNQWTREFRRVLFENHACLYILTDGKFDFPPGWVRRGRKYPVFTDNLLKFHYTRYRYAHEWDEFSNYIVDVYTASPVASGEDPDGDGFDFGFRMLKLHNPAMFNSGALARAKRDAKARRTGPYGLPPSPIQVPP